MNDKTPARHMDNLPEGRKRYWVGTAPIQCDLKDTFPGPHEIKTVFIDGKTVMGPWANMCLRCARNHGVGLGTGRGQEYTKQEDGGWLKTDG